jgi:hypothetical protein
MSIVNHNHPAGSELRGEGLWRTARPTGRDATFEHLPAADQAVFETPSDVAASDVTVSDVTISDVTAADHPGRAEAPLGESAWQARLDGLVSSALSDDAARQARLNAAQAQTRAAFESFRTQCRDELRPVLETSTAMLGEWGLGARVTETLHDKPTRVPRRYDLALRIDRFGERGPGKLTITASEAHEAVRVKITVGPSRICGEVHEHVGSTRASDLSDAMMGGLVATLVERIFTP